MLECAATPALPAMLQNLLYVGAALLLVLLNGFFVAAEFALVKLRQTQATTLAVASGWRGRILLGVHSRLDAYLSACQLGITLASLGLGWIGEPAFAHLLQPLFARLGVGSVPQGRRRWRSLSAATRHKPRKLPPRLRSFFQTEPSGMRFNYPRFGRRSRSITMNQQRASNCWHPPRHTSALTSKRFTCVAWLTCA